MKESTRRVWAGFAAVAAMAVSMPAAAGGDPLALKTESPLTAISEEGVRFITGAAADGAWTYGDFYNQFENTAEEPLQVDIPGQEGFAWSNALRTGDRVYVAATGEAAVAVVRGDLLGSGKWSIAQLVRMAGAMSGSKQLTRAQELAADINGDGRLQINDLVQMAQHDLAEVRPDGTTVSVGHPAADPNEPPQEDIPGNGQEQPSADRLLAIADQLVGRPYVLYTAGPDTFDCSGFVWYALNEAGIPCRQMSSAKYAEVEEWQRIGDAANLQAGDLVFFKSDSGTAISHVGIYTGNGTIIHAAPSIGGVGYSTMASGYYERNFVLGRRLFWLY